MLDKNEKYIFVHMPKTAGTSIERAIRGPKFEGKDHRKMRDYANIVGHENLNSFFKFATIRNPWDKVVSAYFHHKTVSKSSSRITTFCKLNSFSDFVISKYCPKSVIRDYLYINDKICIDYFIKFENLEEDAKYVLQKLGRPTKIPKITHGTKRPTREYKIFYNKETREKIYEAYKEEIELFNYTF